jgi:hypothetical protein
MISITRVSLCLTTIAPSDDHFDRSSGSEHFIHPGGCLPWPADVGEDTILCPLLALNGE